MVLLYNEFDTQITNNTIRNSRIGGIFKSTLLTILFLQVNRLKLVRLFCHQMGVLFFQEQIIAACPW